MGTEVIARGYGVPIVDLDGDAARHTVVDREKDQYLGHPTTVLLEDNRTMYIVYPMGHGRGAIVMKKSTDAGLAWSDRLPVPESWTTSLGVPTIYRTEDPNGKKHLIMFSGLYPIRMARSDDDGETWTPLEPIGDFGGIVAMSDLIRLKGGSYMAVFHDDGRFIRNEGEPELPMKVYKTVSADGGLTWSEPSVVTSHPDAHFCEPGLIRSPDGGRIAMVLRENSRRFNSFVVFSEDEGETWSDPVELPGALTGDRHQAKYAPDGRLLVSFRDQTHVSPTWGDWVAWVGTWDDIVNLREGQYRIRLKDNKHGPGKVIRNGDCAYPAVEILPDGTFVVTTYGHWDANEQPYILSVRFRLSEIDARAGGR